MSYELVVFDWDGTLMDSEARIVACLQEAARESGQQIPSHADAKDVIGLGLTEAVERLFPHVGVDQVERLVTSYRRNFLDDSIAPSVLFGGARAVLDKLSANGRLLAVATGKSRLGLDKVMAETGLGAYFHATRCADETVSKPHPQMLCELMDKLGVSASATLMVGDTEFDMQMARNAGVAAVGVSYGVHDCQRLFANGALHCLDELESLPAWLAYPTAVA